MRPARERARARTVYWRSPRVERWQGRLVWHRASSAYFSSARSWGLWSSSSSRTGETTRTLRGVPSRRWNSPETRQLAAAACFDCHSNETEWPWWSNVAPVSWLVQRDVEEGRQKLNFSEWDRSREEASRAASLVREGEMPPRYYLPLHPYAQLSPEQESALISGLAATFGDRPGSKHQRGEGDHDWRAR